MLSALRSSRSFRLLVVGELVSRSGTAASFVAVWSVAVYEFGVSPGVLSVLAVCNTLPRVVTSMISGRMVDRYGPRVVLLAANLLGLTGSVLQWASPTPLTLGLASIVAGAGFGAFMPAIGSITPRVVTDEHLLPANAILELTWQIGFIIGPLAGALSIVVGGPRAPLLFDAATFAVGIACIAAIKLLPLAASPRPVVAESSLEPTFDTAFDATGEPVLDTGLDAADEAVRVAGSAAAPADSASVVARASGPADAAHAADAADAADAHGRDGAGFLASLRYTWSLPVARFVLVLNTGSWLGISFFIVLEPLFVADVLDAGPVVLGLLQTAFGIGAVIGAVLAARAERRVGPTLLAGTIGVCGVGMVLYTITQSVAVAAAGVGLWGVGIGLWAPLARTMIHRGVPMAHHGRVNGVMSSLQSGLEVLPVLAAGQLAVLVGIQATLIGAGVMSLGLAAWGFLAAGGVERAQPLASPAVRPALAGPVD